MRYIFVLLFLLTGRAEAGGDPLFYIEQPGLEPLPREAIAAIGASSAADSEATKACAFIGSIVKLTNTKPIKYWVATTQGGCYCGAAIRPIVLLQQSNNIWAVLLSYGGYYLNGVRELHHGLPNLIVGTGTAARTEETTWAYNGTRYEQKAR